MSNLARKLQQEQQQQTVQAPQKVRKINSWLSPGEKILGVTFCAAICFGAVHIISNQAAIYELNKDIQNTSVKLEDQQKINNDLRMQVGELSTPDRIRSMAEKLGLKLNDNNVKVVQE
ncbi:cell division protein FtsL [Robertmurraya korlensis]|uniref:cell division protein FtsL n=1 Tax=Robertmurraya korlensis TaxID=519977 RepID=UPI00203F6DED|nr:cell division protein FtsL [Robertmurraya korlensis]MCM3600288.1 cell division protein FtsL [Robertmurraya korlensis]